MSLTLALNTALSGLRVSQRTMAVISHNIANANTEDYSRQVVDLASVTIDGHGQGAKIEDVVRKIDAYLQTSIIRESSNLGEAEIVNTFFERAQVLLGEPGKGTSIDSHIESFFNDLQVMAETPERTSTRAGVISSAVTLAREFSNLAYGMENLRLQADSEVVQAIKVINADIKKLYSLNQAIMTANAFNTPKATLFDQRDAVVKEISEYMDIRVNEKEDGSIHVFVGPGYSLLDDSIYELSYQRIGSMQTLLEDGQLSPIELHRVDGNGNRVGNPLELASGGTSAEITTKFTEGKLKGLLNLRDQMFPDMLEQIDNLAAMLRDSFNQIHNDGSGYPPAAELTGTRLVTASDFSDWEGSVRIAVLDKTGQPATAAYADEDGGFRPLLLDLASLYNGTSTLGQPSVQAIISEINNYFTVQPKLELGNLNQIQLSMLSDKVPGSPSILNFDFNIENISDTLGRFWVNDVQVLDDTGANITSVTNTMPSIDLDAANTFITTAASNTVQVTATAAHGLAVGDVVRLTDPGVAVDGIPGTDFDGYFVVQAVSGNSFSIQVATAATAGMTTGVAAQVAYPPYDEISAGENTRLFQNGSISANVSANTASTFYDFQVTMAVYEPDGTVSNTVVNYRVLAPEVNTRNRRYPADTVIAGSGVIVSPQTTGGYMRAILVDEEGNELPKSYGEYGEQEGYLKLVSSNVDYTIAIDELGSKEMGVPNDLPPRPGSNRGFSWYFELNNFFHSNVPSDEGDTLKNSAYYMAVEERFEETPSLLSTGSLQPSNQPADPNRYPLYTYERFSGDNSIAQQLAELGIKPLDFAAAGGLSEASLSLNGYTGEVLGYVTSLTVSAASTYKNSQILLEGYKQRAGAISGVNLDEEMGNLVIYQNAYTASARVIKVADELFEVLLNTF